MFKYREKKLKAREGLWWREEVKESEVLALVSEMCTSLWHTIHLAKNTFYKTFLGHQTDPLSYCTSIITEMSYRH